MKNIITALIAILLLSCSTKNDKLPETDFKISEYEVLYKKQHLPFGKPIAEWEKIFGKSRRDNDGAYFWDDLGLKLRLGEAGKIAPPADGNLSDIHHVFFKTDVLYIYMIKNPEPWNTLITYPEKTYLKTINFQGAELKSGMSLKEINQIRDDRDLSPFGYLDQGMDPFTAKEDGSTNTAKHNGPYIDAEPQEAEGKMPAYSLYLYFNTNKFEHIEIEANYENGKIQERTYTKMR